MKKTMLITLIAFSLMSLIGCTNRSDEVSALPKVCNDEDSAVKVAIASFIPIYGKEQIESEKPFYGTLMDKEIWIVRGTLPEGTLGGTAYAKIRKSNCEVIQVTHFS